MAAGLLAVAGCGSDEEQTDAAAPTTTAASGAFPVTIEHKFGTTEIPAEPKRVVSLGFNEQDTILAFGVKPIAVRYWFGDESDVVFPWAEDALASAEGQEGDPEIMNFASKEVNFEQVTALRPDLISGLYSGMDADTYTKLSQIAPTIAQSDEYVDYGTPWQEVTKTVGRALGQEERAEELVAGVEAQFVAAQDRNPGFVGKSVAVASNATEGQYYIFSSQDGRARPLTNLGLEVPDELDQLSGDRFFAEISGEQLDLLDVDVLIWLLAEGESQAGVEDVPLVGQLGVIKESRAVFIDGELNDALNFATVLSLPFFLDGVVPMLAAAVDGDPATKPNSPS